MASRRKESRRRVHGGSRNDHLLRRYGITAAEAVLEAQGGLCAICCQRPAEHELRPPLGVAGSH